MIQLYADFSGGIDIILGISEMFGIRLPENFDRALFIPEPGRVLAAVAYDPDAVVPGVYLFPRIHQPGGQEAFCGCWPPGPGKRPPGKCRSIWPPLQSGL